MKALIIKTLSDCFTGIDGQTVNPVRLIGYTSCTTAVAVYFGNSMYMAFTKSTFDYVGFGTGFSLLMAGLVAVGAAEAVKKNTEPPASDPPKGEKDGGK